MNAGQLRHRVAVQSKTEARDAYGGVTETWATASTVWASIEPMRAGELFQGQQVDARLSHRIIMRYYDGLTNQHRLLFETTRVFNIHAVRNVQEREVMTEALCMEQT